MSRLLVAAVAFFLGANHALATVTITPSTSAAALAAAITAGNSGITLTGTPTLTNGGSTNAQGTFTTTGSNLGLAGGIILGTGNVSLIPGSPLPYNGGGGSNLMSSAGTGISPATAPANEYDINTFTFSFIPKPGVNRMSIASVFASDEYNKYVNTTFTDNFSMVINGGAYANVNIATIPGTSTGTDINTVNNGAYPGYYRDNSVATSPIPDIRFWGATTVFINAFNVVPGTTYTLTIRVADVGDASYDSAVFVSTSTILNNPPSLDLSTVASGTGYTNTWVQGGAGASIADAAGDTIVDDGATISSATITITNLVAGDLLAAGALPGGIVASAYNSGTGVITLTGVATLAQYQAALQAVTYSSTAANPAGPNKLINVVVNDGVDNSNTTVATIQMATLSLTKAASAPTVNLGTSNTLTDAGDKITYTYVLTNNGTVALTAAAPVDIGPKFNGVAGSGTMSAFAPVTASIAVGASQTYTATYTLSATDVINGAGVTNGVANTASAKGTEPTGKIALSSNATATTSILTVAGLSVTKTAAAPTINLGSSNAFTDAGDTITFTYVLKNIGSVALTAAFPSDAGPKFNGVAGTNVLSAFTPAAGVSLAVGASATFTTTYTLSLTDVKNGVGITNGVTNTASATAKSPTLTTVTAANSTATTTIPAVASMTITKNAVLTDTPGLAAGKADLNEIITYTYVVKNTGNVPMTAVSVKDLHGGSVIPVVLGAGGITSETLTTIGPYGAAASPDTTANDGIWSTLAPGAGVTFTWVHTVDQAEIDKG